MFKTCKICFEANEYLSEDDICEDCMTFVVNDQNSQEIIDPVIEGWPAPYISHP